MDKIWIEMYDAAKSVLGEKKISDYVIAGGVSAAVRSKSGNIYVGVCIDTCSTLGICAERNAIFNMITNGESEIEKIVCIDSKGKLSTPCGACRELIMQLNKKSKDIKFLVDCDNYKYITMEELMPNWWGYDRFNNQ